jgi:hypothetical protein
LSPSSKLLRQGYPSDASGKGLHPCPQHQTGPADVSISITPLTLLLLSTIQLSRYLPDKTRSRMEVVLHCMPFLVAPNDLIIP